VCYIGEEYIESSFSGKARFGVVVCDQVGLDEEYSGDYSLVRPVYVSAAVTVGEFEGEISAPGWQPPDWGFDSGCEECNELTS